MNFRNARYIFIPNTVKITNNGVNFARNLLEVDKYYNYNTHQITLPNSVTNLSNCFAGLNRLNDTANYIVFTEDWNIPGLDRTMPGCATEFSNVTDMSYAYAGARLSENELKYGENVQNISHIYEYAYNRSGGQIILPQCGNNVVDMSYAYRNC